MKHSFSRRQALAGISTALAGAGAPAAAAVLPAAIPQTDPKFETLVAQFEPLFAEWCRHSYASTLDFLEYDIAFYKRIGIERGAAVNRRDHADILYELSEDSRIANRFESEPYDRCVDLAFPIADEILTYEVETREELALQAQALFMLHHCEMQDDLRQFLKNVAAFCGTKLPDDPTEADLVADAKGVELPVAPGGVTPADNVI
jgi:hypothetical protein